MLTRNGSCVTAIENSSAGSSGSRRRHGEENGSPTFPFPLSVASAATVMTDRYLIALDAICWHWLSAVVSFIERAITLEKSWVHRLPTSWNCGMPTYCTPGRPGRLVVPGLLIGAAFIAARVFEANAAAARLYWGISYVESRVPGGIAAQPPFVFVPAALMYDGPVAHAMYFQASAGSGELFGIASAQLHSHPDAFVFTTGASA